MARSHINETDFAVIGSGVAGLRAAVELASRGWRVTVLTKSGPSESNTQYAQGGIAAALNDEDEIVLHYQDTVAAGDHLCNEDAVHVLVEEGPRYIQELIQWGTEFDRDGTKLAFTREGAHSRSRVLHAHGDSTGREIGRALFARVKTLKTIELLPYSFTTNLIVEAGRVAGVTYLDERSHTVRELRCRSVLLATGGLGQIYSETTNPAVATGDGIAIAFRAGARIANMEFVQFHPTALYVEGAPRFLLSEALRGEGGVLRNINLERFMPGYSPEGELAPRDVVSRAIVAEMEKTGSGFVYLDMTELPERRLVTRFPRIQATCQDHNLDLANQLIPVRPAAHYAMGGVATDLDGWTSIPGLYAAGEVACNGVHGANRLASNSLLEGLVYGARAGIAMAAEAGQAASTRADSAMIRAKGRSGNQPDRQEVPPQLATELEHIRATMWASAGIMRTRESLEAGVEELARWEKPLPEDAERIHYETANQLLTGSLVLRAALAREESRGAHYRTDFPIRRDDMAGVQSFISVGREVEFAAATERIAGELTDPLSRAPAV